MRPSSTEPIEIEKIVHVQTEQLIINGELKWSMLIDLLDNESKVEE